MRLFTAQFGMGWGVTRSLKPPGHPKPLHSQEISRQSQKLSFQPTDHQDWSRHTGGFVTVRVFRFHVLSRRQNTERVEFKPIEQLVPVSFTPYGASTSGLSTWSSSTALIGKPCFEGGFTLRCLQHLSIPHIATRRCRWRDNRYTRGASIPVLSY